MEPGPLACSDAERRAARALAATLRGFGRRPRTEGRWVRPAWPLVQALCAAAGVVLAVVGVAHPLAGTIGTGAALLLSLAEGRGRLPLGRGRATQDVLAPAPRPTAVTLVALAAVDRPRSTLLWRVPSPLAWVAGALALQTAGSAVRLSGIDGTWLGALQLLPSVVLLVMAGLLAEAATARPLDADAAATDAALALAEAAPWADVVLVGASDIARPRRVRAERRPPQAVVLLWLEPATTASWSTRHPTLAAVADGLGAPRVRGAGLRAGSRPAMALRGPADALPDLAVGFAAALRRQLDGASDAK